MLPVKTFRTSWRFYGHEFQSSSAIACSFENSIENPFYIFR